MSDYNDMPTGDVWRGLADQTFAAVGTALARRLTSLKAQRDVAFSADAN